VRSGEFRSDLYFRLGVVTINAPPLRERGRDIVLVAEHFLEGFSRSYGRPRLTLGRGAIDALLRHPWPGNVRELRNVMEQAVLFTVGQTIEASDLGLREPSPLQAPPAQPGAAPEAAKPAGTLVDVERDLIMRALSQRKGNVTLAARDLGISRDTLRYRMERHSLRRESFV